MNFVKQKGPGLLLCLVIALPSWWLGKLFPVIGGPVFAILCGMIITLLLITFVPAISLWLPQVLAQ